MEHDVTVEIRITYAAAMDTDADAEADGDVLVEETMELEADQELELDGDVEYRYGGYWAAVEVAELAVEAALDWQMSHEYARHGTIHLGRDREGTDAMVFYEHSHFYPEGEMPSCEWADDGELLEGPGAD